MSAFAFRMLSSMNEVTRAAWDALLDERATPFLRWDFLAAMEAGGCVGAVATGDWLPRHLTLWRGERLVAAAPAYLKQGSDGDFARDWDWASAAQRAGIRFYPKLCVTVPFTPATGRRFLIAADVDRTAALRALLDGAIATAKSGKATTVQVLFPLPDEAAELEALGMAIRLSYQFHWKNDKYTKLQDFLDRLDAKKRHQQKRERAAPATQGITIRTLRKAELDANPVQWAHTAYALHRATIDKLPWGRGWLTERFYEIVFAKMSDNIELVVAEREGHVIAGAVNVASRTRLYGRYWGCFEDHPFLHFNVCLYHSIDECIARGTLVFEGGAGGEHKLARGFEPSETYSAHLFFHPRLDVALRSHLAGETASIKEGIADWRSRKSLLKDALVDG